MDKKNNKCPLQHLHSEFIRLQHVYPTSFRAYKKMLHFKNVMGCDKALYDGNTNKIAWNFKKKFWALVK